MLKSVFLSTAALALIAAAANARFAVPLSHDNGYVSVMPDKTQTIETALPNQ